MSATLAIHPPTTSAERTFDAGELNVAAALAPPARWSLRQLFALYRWPILYSYGLFNLENLIRLAQPWALGLAIHDLLLQSYRGLIVFLGQQACYTVVAAARRMYDTRVFRGIYADFAGRLVHEQRRRQVDVSRVAARSGLAREVVDFFERNVPHLLFSLYSVVGAAIMLCLYDPLLAAMCLLLLPPVWWFGRAYGRRTLGLNKELNDKLEHEVDIIQRGCPDEVRAHYQRLGGGLVRLSDLEAWNFTRLQLFILALTAASLVRCCQTGQTDAGAVLAVFGYVMMFVGGLAITPQLVQQLNRLRDIAQRLQGGL